MPRSITVNVNGTEHTALVDERLLLVHFLRDAIGHTGTHVGCDTSSCGACTVLLDGKSVKSCIVLAVQVDGSEITTVEGLSEGGDLHPVQKAFQEEHGLQCGFCTPGMVITTLQILDRNPHPSEDEIRKGLRGNLCRCTGYQNIVNAVKSAVDGGI